MQTLIDPWCLSAIQPSPLCEYARNDRGQIASWVREAFAVCYPGDEANGSCLYWTWAGCQILRRCGFRAILQAGTMSWPMAPDRGGNPTHFSYEWDPESPGSATAMVLGKMPEVHCWCALPDEGDIVDFSTGHFRKLAEGRHGLTWELDDPPDYFWYNAHELPEGVIYRASMDAIRYVLGVRSVGLR